MEPQNLYDIVQRLKPFRRALDDFDAGVEQMRSFNETLAAKREQLADIEGRTGPARQVLAGLESAIQQAEETHRLQMAQYRDEEHAERGRVQAVVLDLAAKQIEAQRSAEAKLAALDEEYAGRLGALKSETAAAESRLAALKAAIAEHQERLRPLLTG